MTGIHIARGIEAFIQREFMALTDDEFEAVYMAHLSCLTADRADHCHQITQKMHRDALVRFASTCGARW